MNRIINFCPHAFTFFLVEDCTIDPKSRKYILAGEGATPSIYTSLPSGTVLRAATEQPEMKPLSVEGVSIPQTDFRVTQCDPIPSLSEGEIGIVSFLYMAAAKAAGLDTSKLRTTVPCYLTPEGLPYGVVKLSV